MSSRPMRPCYEASFMVKFLGKRDHAEKFLSGAMLARRLNYFKTRPLFVMGLISNTAQNV